MFITFEGIDGSGKTTLSQFVAQKLDYVWTKEPTFSSEQADNLNLKGLDSANREVEFLLDRVKHQGALLNWRDMGKNIICDRYIWTGLAYCKVFNPSVYDFCSVLYSHEYFKKPDLYVFVDTSPEICCQRRRVPAQMSNLIRLREAYKETESEIIKESAVYTIDGNEDLDKLTDELVNFINGQVHGQ